MSAFTGGCQSMWWLWYSDGWRVLYSVPVFMLWIVWHGYHAEKRAGHYPWYRAAFVVELPFRVLMELGFLSLFRVLVSFNPPPWDPGITWDYVPLSWVGTVAVKHTVTGYILLLSAYTALSLEPVRKFLGLREKPAQREINATISASLLLACCLWAIDSVVDFFIFNNMNKTFLEIFIISPGSHELFVRMLYFVLTLTGAITALGIIKRRTAAEKAYREILLLTNDAVIATDMNGNVKLFNRGAEQISAVSVLKT